MGPVPVPGPIIGIRNDRDRDRNESSGPEIIRTGNGPDPGPTTGPGLGPGTGPGPSPRTGPGHGPKMFSGGGLENCPKGVGRAGKPVACWRKQTNIDGYIARKH